MSLVHILKESSLHELSEHQLLERSVDEVVADKRSRSGRNVHEDAVEEPVIGRWHEREKEEQSDDDGIADETSIHFDDILFRHPGAYEL